MTKPNESPCTTCLFRPLRDELDTLWAIVRMLRMGFKPAETGLAERQEQEREDFARLDAQAHFTATQLHRIVESEQVRSARQVKQQAPERSCLTCGAVGAVTGECLDRGLCFRHDKWEPREPESVPPADSPETPAMGLTAPPPDSLRIIFSKCSVCGFKFPAGVKPTLVKGEILCGRCANPVEAKEPERELLGTREPGAPCCLNCRWWKKPIGYATSICRCEKAPKHGHITDPRYLCNHFKQWKEGTRLTTEAPLDEEPEPQEPPERKHKDLRMGRKARGFCSVCAKEVSLTRTQAGLVCRKHPRPESGLPECLGSGQKAKNQQEQP